jgi:hypothetical protein
MKQQKLPLYYLYFYFNVFIFKYYDKTYFLSQLVNLL